MNKNSKVVWLFLIASVLLVIILYFIKDRYLTAGVVLCGDAEGHDQKSISEGLKRTTRATRCLWKRRLQAGENLRVKSNLPRYRLSPNQFRPDENSAKPWSWAITPVR